MDEAVAELSFSLGLPTHDNVENTDLKQAILKAFRELKSYMRTPVDKTVPYSKQIKLKDVGIDTKRVLYCFASRPRAGSNLGASMGPMGMITPLGILGNRYTTTPISDGPIMTEIAKSQVRNSITSDFQWHYDITNDIVSIAHSAPIPKSVTIRYVPEFKDVSEIVGHTWVDYLLRLAEAHVKKAWGRSRTKYTVNGSNVTLDGETLLNEAQAELDTIREELKNKTNRTVILK